MNCGACGFEIQSGFAFCPKCGAKQAIACAACGYLCPPDFAFCPKCGGNLHGGAPPGKPAHHEPTPARLLPRGVSAEPPPQPTRASIATEADRRTITALFADLSGFTALSERLDPEVMQTLQNELFEELTAAVQSYGGFVDKFVGDALLALFGAPVAHEDDPERALRAALDMMLRTARLSERWQPRAGMSLMLHIGINTGPVVAGGFGAGSSKAYSVTGDTVNTAQRLQSVAAPGEVLVGPVTYRLTRHAYAFDALGDLALKGKAGGVPVHRLGGPLETPRLARGLEALGLAAPVIGRDGELARLFNAIELSGGGTAQLIRLIGDAGIGKSRLIAEFLTRMRDDVRFADVAIRRAACSPLGEQPYGTLAAVLRSAYGIAAKDSADEVRTKLVGGLDELGVDGEASERLMPLLVHVLGLGDAAGVLRHVEPEQLKRQIFFAIRTIFERRLALAPLVLVIEDLHWADAASLEVLRFLIDRLERSRLLLLVSHRPAFDADPLGSSRISHVALRLQPLDSAACRALLEALFGRGSNGLPGDLQARIIERSGGNPLFLEEIVRGLIEAGALARDGTGWRVTANQADADIPLGIQGLLLARMDRLPREARQLAQEAAVIGPRFDAALLKAVCADPVRLQASLDVLCDAELIDEGSATSTDDTQHYRFTQALFQDVIYQNLLLQRRSELHGRIGRAMERLCGEAPERLEDLAALGHHFSLSEVKAKGARYLKAAGERASAAYANDDAIRLYQTALSTLLAANDGGLERLEICERLGDLCRPAGRRDTAYEHYEMVLRAHRDAGDGAAQARLLRKLGGLLWDVGKRDQAEARYAEAEALLESSEAPIERAHLLQERGRIAFRTGDHAAAAKWADQALGYATSLSADPVDAVRLEAIRVTADALNTKGVALARLGRSGEALREVERSVAIAESAELLNAACRGYTNLGVLYTVVDPARAIEVCRRGLEIATRIGDLGFQARLYANLAVACCTFTDRCTDEGVPAAEKAVEIDRSLDQREHLAVPLTVLGQIHQCHDRPDLAFRYYSEALEVARETGEPQLLFPCYDGLATLCLDRDDMAEAERYFGLAQDICTKHGFDPETLVVLPFLD